MKLFSKKIFIGIFVSMFILGASLNAINAQNARTCDSINDPQERDVCIQSFQRYVYEMQRYRQRTNGARPLNPADIIHIQAESEHCRKSCSGITEPHLRKSCFQGCYFRVPTHQ